MLKQTLRTAAHVQLFMQHMCLMPALSFAAHGRLCAVQSCASYAGLGDAYNVAVL